MSRPFLSSRLAFLLIAGCLVNLQTGHAAAKEAPEGQIILSPASLFSFTEVKTGMFSDVQFYEVGGHGLESELTVSVSGPFRLSLHCLEGYTGSLSLTPDEGILQDTRVYVRFFPQETGLQEGSIVHQSEGAEDQSLSLTGSGVGSLIPQEYYTNATGGGIQLKTSLHQIINGHNIQSYSGIWTHFESTDSRFDGSVWDMYSDVPCADPPYRYSFFTDQDVGLAGNKEGEVYNREHSMPRSWFGGAISPMNTDLHHIYPSDKWVNARRDNYPYAEVDQPQWTSLNGSRLGHSTTMGYSGLAFEPIDAYKGDLARALFYMVTCYQDQLTEWDGSPEGNSILAQNSYPAFHPWAVDMLVEWHENDPVSQKEVLRNHAVYQIQGNRNPFVDHPEFVGKIWGDTTLSSGKLAGPHILRVFPNPVQGNFMFEASEEIQSIRLVNLLGMVVFNAHPHRTTARITLPALPEGVYLIQFIGKERRHHQKVIIAP